MCRREVCNTLGCSVHRKPYIIHNKWSKVSYVWKWHYILLKVFLYLIIHLPSFYLNPTLTPKQIIKQQRQNAEIFSFGHIWSILPLQFSSAYPSAGTPIPSSPRRTSPAARLSPLTSPSHCAPGDSAGPWLSSVCPPGASAALPSPGGVLMSRRSVLERSVTPRSQELPLTGPLHWSTQHPL